MLSRAQTVRRAAFLATLGLFSFYSGAFFGTHRRGRFSEATASAAAPTASRSPGDTGTACPLPHPAEPPTFEAIDFVEDSGGKMTLGYDHLCALALSAQRNTLILEYTAYQGIIEGQNLEKIYEDLRKHRIGALQASSFANAETLTLPVVPRVSRPRSSAKSYENRAWGNAQPPLIPLPEDVVGDEPVIARVRVVLPSPYSFGKAGEYIREEE